MTIPIFAFSDKTHFGYLNEVGARNRLISYFYIVKTKFALDELYYERDTDDFYLLDSGAFSAWRQGVTIDVYEYIEFVHKVKDVFTHFVSLDVIDDPIVSEANHRIMLEEGCESVVPVFHSGESMNVLHYLVEQGYPYIGISPNNDWAESQKVKWLIDVWSQVDLSNTMTHGFGYMGKRGLSAVPLTTADSAGWMLAGGMGNIETPIGTIIVSDVGKENNKHIDNLSPDRQAAIYEWIEKMDIRTLDELRVHHSHRKIFNAKSLEHIVSQIVGERTYDRSTPRTGSLFGDFDNTGFGYTDEPFSHEAVEQTIKKIKNGWRKEIPRSVR